MEQIKRYQVCYASDDNYASVMGTSLFSLLENNTDIDCLDINILSNNLNSSNKNKIIQVVQQFNRECYFYELSDKLLHMARREKAWNVTTYARLFISDVLPDRVEEVLYIDCDTLIIGSISELFKTSRNDGNIIYGVLDRYNVGSIKRLNLQENIYINAGITMMNLTAWRREHISEKMKDVMGKCEWQYPDQDMLNVVLAGRIGIIPMYYNMYMFSRVMPYAIAMKISYKGIDEYYTESDYEYARKNTKIIHFAGSLFNRPWQKKSRQTDHELFDGYYMRTPWREQPYKKRKYTNKVSTSFYFWIVEKVLWKSWHSCNYKRFIKDYLFFNELPVMVKKWLLIKNKDRRKYRCVE